MLQPQLSFVNFLVTDIKEDYFNNTIVVTLKNQMYLVQKKKYLHHCVSYCIVQLEDRCKILVQKDRKHSDNPRNNKLSFRDSHLNLF